MFKVTGHEEKVSKLKPQPRQVVLAFEPDDHPDEKNQSVFSPGGNISSEHHPLKRCPRVKLGVQA
jgi:hypothetical protein